MPRTGSLNKSARLIALQTMIDAGSLPESVPEIARLFSTSRWTIYRDLADLEKLRPLLADLRGKVGLPQNPVSTH